MRRVCVVALAALLILGSTAAGPHAQSGSTRPLGAAAVSHERLAQADREPGEWMALGGSYLEQHYSPLDQLNETTVTSLGLAWSANIDTERGQEATPVVVDGMLYISTAWSMVKAYDVQTGTLRWQYDPAVAKTKAADACCDVVNRGVAVWNGKVYIGVLDGRLVALNGATGAVVWSTQTTDPAQPYTITGAPRIVKGRVIIGNGGAEYRGRGYVTAYDAETGRQAWRWYTVPGDPSKPYEQPELARAARTWRGDYYWKIGRGRHGVGRHGLRPGALSVIDAETNVVIGTIPLGKRPRGIAASPDGTTLFIALSGSPAAPPGVDERTLPPPDRTADGIGVVDIASMKLVRTLPSGPDPEVVAVSHDGTRVFVANEDAAKASVVDAPPGRSSRRLLLAKSLKASGCNPASTACG